MIRSLLLATCIVASSMVAHAADVVTFKNGDRISGAIVKMDGENLVITTPYVEKMSVAWKEVATVESDAAHIVRVKPGDFVTTRLQASADGIVLAGDTLRGARTLRPDEIASIDIPPGAHWEGTLQANVAGTAGNIQTFAMGGMGEAIRKTDDDRLRFGASTEVREAQTEQNGRKKLVQTGQAHRAWALYDYNLDAHWSLGGYTRFEHDKFKDLNYRALVGGGPRYRFFDTKEKLLSVYLGLAYIYEDFNSRVLLVDPTADKSRDFVSLALGDEFKMNVTDTLSVYQSLDVYPNVEDFQDTLFHAEAGLRQKLIGGLFVGIGLGDDFDNKPAKGRKKNDFLYTGTVGYQF